MRAALMLPALLFFAGCAKKAPKRSSVAGSSPGRTGTKPAPAIPVPIGYLEMGLASWYGVPYHGRQAASGEIYDMEAMVAAHKTIPFQTWVKVTLLSTGKSVNLRVIDRGPFIGGRILDLSHAGAREIGLLGPGVGRIRMEVIPAPATFTAVKPIEVSARFAVQIGTFRDEANADRAVFRYSALYGTATKVARSGATRTYRVLVGNLASQEEAEELLSRISGAETLQDAFVVRLDP